MIGGNSMETAASTASYGFGTALILGLYAYVAVIISLGPGLRLNEPIVAGAFTGLVIGDVKMGLAVGGKAMLMSLGMHPYGGATIPDFLTGAILGTAFGAIAAPGDIQAGMASGLAIAVPASLLMTQLEILGRSLTTIFIHAADRYVEQGNFRGFSLMHILGQLPWGLARFVPIFLAVKFGSGAIQSFIEWMPEWFMKAMGTTGAILPALGFALLLGMLPVRKYFSFLLIGYVLFSYLHVPVIGIALIGVALALIYLQMKDGEVNAWQ